MSFQGNQYIWKDRKRFLGMPLSFSRYALSRDRLFFSVGFLNVCDEEVLLYRIRDISVRRSLWQRIFGVGSIQVISADKTTPQLILKNVKHPQEIKELLHANVEECKIRRRMRVSEMMAEVQDDHDDDGDLDDFDDVPDAN